MKQFKHESDDYEPFGDQGGTYERPWWVPDDEVMLRDENNRIYFRKIADLTEEEIERYKKEGRI